MEISVENEKNEEDEKDKSYLNLFHEGDIVLYGNHYCLITGVDKNDDDLPLRITSLDDVVEYRNQWIGLPENPEEYYTIGVNLFPASQYHLSIVKNDN